ncbi:MAG: alpha/beta fold hydrolase [Bifidobacterium longum]|nr:alpha/beta fold hydrolase [Bifidobacterium longum]
MTMLSKYHVPGLAIEDHSIDVPLDWTGHEPGRAFDGETIKLFYRVVTAPEHVHDDLPLLIFLQGGPGGAGPRLNSPTSDGWIEEAIRHFRVILPDQRGTGRSSRVDTHAMARIAAAHDDDAAAGARAQADYLKKFLADSIVRDFEHLRLTEFGGRKWVTMGQSYFPRMVRKTTQFYERYPQDKERVAAIADKLPTTAEVAEFVGKLTDSVLNPMAGTDVEHRLGVIAGMAAHGFPLRPLNFTGEAMFPWMFEQESALRPFRPAMDLLMEDTRFGVIYDEDQLARNEVPLQAAVYFDDMYVDSGLQLDTLSRVGNSHYWTTNEFEHDGLHGPLVFKHLYDEALNRGDLEELF